MQANKSKTLNKARPNQPNNGRPKSEARPLRFRGQNTDYAREVNNISKDGADWLVAAVDPFHDFNRQIAGFPDMDGSSSVVACTTAQFDVAAPGAVAWDCNIFTLPIAQEITVNRYYAANGSVSTLSQTGLLSPLVLGSVNAISVTAGEQTFPQDNLWNPAGYSSKYVNLSEGSQGDVARLVGWGIEIINTSPELNKSGMLTAYRVAQRPSDSVVNMTDVTAGNLCKGPIKLVQYCKMPTTVEEATVLPHSQGWEAKEGAYIPVSMSSISNAARNFQYEAVSFGAQNYSSGAKSWFGTKVIGAAAEVLPISPLQRTLPYDSVGAYLTNLDPKSTFTVKVKYYFEKFPGTTDVQLLPLCTPSPRYDVAALQLYAQLLHDLPIATKSDNNANGDWFKGILKHLRTLGLPILSLLPGGQRLGGRILDVADHVVGGISKVFPLMP